MIQDIISECSIICNLKEVIIKAKIRSARKLPDIQYFINSHPGIKTILPDYSLRVVQYQLTERCNS